MSCGRPRRERCCAASVARVIEVMEVTKDYGERPVPQPAAPLASSRHRPLHQPLRQLREHTAAAAESMPDRLAAGGGDRCDAGESCEGGFGADAAWVRPRDEHVCGDDRADAGLLE